MTTRAPLPAGAVHEMVSAHGELLASELREEGRRAVAILVWLAVLCAALFFLAQTVIVGVLAFCWDHYRWVGLASVAVVSALLAVIARYRLARWTHGPVLGESLFELRKSWSALVDERAA
jgi:uncharacterized membrane protein YqjE